MTLLDQIDRAIDGLCPCGAEPREGSAYCGPDCEPTHISDDTEAPAAETARPGLDYFDPRYAPPTPMRWRPDLVTAADDTDLIPLGSETHGYTGRFNAQVYERISAPDTWHLRLNDGHRFVGVDLTDVGGRQDPITEDLVGRVREAWQRLERELTDTRRLVPDGGDTGDPWADVIPAVLSHGQAVVVLRRADDGLMRELATYHPTITRARRSYHDQAMRAMDVAAADMERVGRRVQQSLQPFSGAAEEFLRQVGLHLTDWQRQILEQMYAADINSPRRTGRSPHPGLLPGYMWERCVGEPILPSDRGRAASYRAAPAQNQDEAPADPMLRAIEAKRNRNTGPPTDRLDGRRRRRR